MSAILRSTGAVGLMFAIACGAAASVTPETNCTPPDWQETCTLPSVTAGSRVIHDEQVTPAGDNEAAEKPAASEGCDNCDSCQSCTTCCCEPSCYAMVGTVFLHRSRPDAATVLGTSPGPGSVINAGDFDFGWDAGPDVTIGKHLSNGLIVEGRYFSDHSAEATRTVSGVGSVVIPGLIFGGLFPTPPLVGSYHTDLDSSELNVGTAVTPGCTLFTGFRWIELHDQLHTGGGGFPTIGAWDENNHLYGAQIGTNILFTNPCSPFRFTGTLKAGAYGNVADNQFISAISSARDHDDDISFVGEVDFTALYHVTQHIGVYGGLQVLWLDNVAVAGDQAPTTHALGPTISPINTEGRVFYDGVTTGVDFTW